MGGEERGGGGEGRGDRGAVQCSCRRWQRHRTQQHHTAVSSIRSSLGEEDGSSVVHSACPALTLHLSHPP